MSRSLFFNFQISSLGVPRTASRSVSVRQQLAQLLFTIKGERLNRPEFGCGVQQMVFGGTSPEIALAVEHLVEAAILEHLDDLIEVEGVRVTTEDATLTIDVVYTMRESGEQGVESFTRPLEGSP